jgi:hypothetical protein
MRPLRSFATRTELATVKEVSDDLIRLQLLGKHPEITSQFFADIPPESALKNGNLFLDAALASNDGQEVYIRGLL